MASFYGRTLRTGSFIRYAAEQYRYEDEYVCYEVGVRGKLRDRARELGDPDIGDFRADNTCGWKARKHRHQWEHRVLAAEKREKKRRRKAGVDSPVGLGPEGSPPRRKKLPEAGEA